MREIARGSDQLAALLDRSRRVLWRQRAQFAAALLVPILCVVALTIAFYSLGSSEVGPPHWPSLTSPINVGLSRLTQPSCLPLRATLHSPPHLAVASSVEPQSPLPHRMPGCTPS